MLLTRLLSNTSSRVILMVRQILLLIFAIGLSGSVPWPPASEAMAATGADAPSAIRVVTSRTDSGAGSFRQALRDARAGDTILFDPAVFPPVNPATIALLSTLPALTQGDLVVDASNAGVILDGQHTPAGTNGLDIVSSRNTVRGLQIIHFPNNGIAIHGGAQYNLIGGNWQTGRAPYGEGNIITLNGGNGIAVAGAGTDNNTISGNLLGLDADGTQDFRVQAMALSPAYAQDRTVFVGTRYQGVLKSTDAGATWTTASTGLTISDVRTLAISAAYATDSTLFAGTAGGGVFRSTDGGRNWSKLLLAAAGDRNLLHLALSPNYRSDRTVFAAVNDTALFTSTDGGSTWSAPTAGFDGRAWSIIGIVFSPGFAGDHTVFAYSVNRVYQSVDNGRTWIQLSVTFSKDIRALAVSPGYPTDRTLFAALRDCSLAARIWRSTDAGSHWQSLSGTGALCETRAMAISPAFASDRTIFAVDDWGGVVRSVDGGANWTRLASSRYNRAVVISPAYAQDKTVLVGQYNGEMRKSTDKGANWGWIGSSLTEAGNVDDGIRISDGAQRNTVGGATLGERNVISNNGLHGVLITGQNTGYNRIIGNTIGANAIGTAPLGNDAEGILIESGAHHNQVGSALPGEGNLISANATTGLAIWQSAPTDNTVVANYIGTDMSGTKPLGNHDHGVCVSNTAQRTRIGGAIPAERNVISSNGFHGIIVADANTANNIITGNYIGVDASGTQRLGNYQVGIGLSNGTHTNTIGGAAPGERNVVSANGTHGIGFWDTGTDDNVMVGNYVGMDATGTVPLGNQVMGVVIATGAKRNRIGGATTGERNVIAGNGWDGILITEPGTDDNRVIGNYIGVDATGAAAPGQEHIGVLLDAGAQRNEIGGTSASERNVIGGNKTAGIGISKAATQNNIVAGNTIGVNAAGTAPLSNGIGVAFWEGSQLNTVAGNLIGGNLNHGVQIDDAYRNTIQDNLIGTNAGGVADLGNSENGIALFNGAQDNVIGPGNVIAYNHARGIQAWGTATRGNRITRNAIYGNTERGMLFTDGAQGELSAPAITAAEATRVSGIAPVAGATVEIFSDDGEQGRIYEGNATSDVNGRFVFIKAAGLSGPNFTATATDGAGNTTAFSRPFAKPPVDGGDSYEPDDTCRNARSVLADGTVQSHTFHQSADTDWVVFTAQAGTTYLIAGQPMPDAPTDLALEIYDRCDGLPDETQDHAFAPGVQLQYRASASGALYLRIVNHTPSDYGPQMAYELSVRALDTAPSPGALILVAGRLRNNDLLQANIHRVAEQVYRLFGRNHYGDDRILYLATDSGLPGVDGSATAASLQEAITHWARDRVDARRALTLYMIDHGSADRFYLDGARNEWVTPAQINAWLAELEAARSGVKINVIIEACYSGSFINGAESISKPGRVLIASTTAGEQAWASQDGAVFSDQIIMRLGQQLSLLNSFQEASAATQAAHRWQIPWLDDNGDGIANEPDDGMEAARRGFSYPGTMPEQWPPYIVEATTKLEDDGQRRTIRARVLDNVHVDDVWALIYPPSYRPPTIGEEWAQDTMTRVALYRPTGDWLNSDPQRFDEAGTYRIVIYAEDNENLQARPATITVQTGRAVYLPLMMQP